MMHIQDTVISIVGQDKKSFREYDVNKQDTTRSCRVVLPFETEYQFLIKNHGNRSICLKATIDGSDIFNAGLVIAPFTTAYVERFLNSDRKFKFVRKNSDQVSDPSNPSNGQIVITVEHAQALPVYTPQQPVTVWPTWLPNNTPVQQPQIHWNQNPATHTYGKCGGSSTDMGDLCSGTDWMQAEYSRSSDDIQLTSCSTNKSPGVPLIAQDYSLNQIQVSSCLRGLEAGATIEGSKSNQTFNTVMFNGEGFVS